MEDFHLAGTKDSSEITPDLLEFEIRPIYEESCLLNDQQSTDTDGELDLDTNPEYILPSVSSLPTSPLNILFPSFSSRPSSPNEDDYLNSQGQTFTFTTFSSCIPGSTTEMDIPNYLLSSISNCVPADIMESVPEEMVSRSDTQSPIPSSCSTSTVPEEKVEVELKPEVEVEGSGVRDGKDGWTDLKKNGFLRREFFKFYNESKAESECSICPKPNKAIGIVRPIYNLSNYYHTSEQTVCLESYYYGSVKGRNVTLIDCCPNKLKCPECKKGVSKKDLFRHIVTHINGIKTFSKAHQKQVCKYCLHPVKATSRMIDHVEKRHRKFCTNGHCCRICNITFEDPIKTTIHMWKSHCESELPYKCPICGFQASFLHAVVDHFDQEHLEFKNILCPLCLKSFRFSVPLKEYDDIAQHIIGHKLQGNSNVACGSCALKFVEDYDYVRHVSDKSLHSSMKSAAGFEAYIPARDGKSKVLLMAKDPNTIETIMPCPHSLNLSKKPRTEPCSFTEAHEEMFSKVLGNINPSSTSKVDVPKKFHFPSPRVMSK